VTPAASGVEAGAAAPDRDERFLRHVLGDRGVADDAVRKRVRSAAVAVVENLERSRVLALDERHQILVGEPPPSVCGQVLALFPMLVLTARIWPSITRGSHLPMSKKIVCSTTSRPR